MCEFCKIDESGDSFSNPLISNADSLFETDFQVEQRIFDGVVELYIGIGGTQILCHKQKWWYCPICGRKLNGEESGNCKEV